MVDSVRTLNQIHAIKECYGATVSHIRLTAPLEVLEKRYNSRLVCVSGGGKSLTYRDICSNQTESLVEDLQASADIVIDTIKCSNEYVLSRVVSYLEVCGKSGGGN